MEIQISSLSESLEGWPGGPELRKAFSSRPIPGLHFLLIIVFTNIAKEDININPLRNRRILVIDDNRAIHDDIRKILIKSSGDLYDLREEEEALFGDTTDNFQL